MGYFKVVTLYCDCDGCEGCGREPGQDCLEWYEYDRSSAMEARENAKNVGWVYRNGEDYCPNCK